MDIVSNNISLKIENKTEKKIPKKRGRKPKAENSTLTSTSTSTSTATGNVDKVKKKRGRKPKTKSYSIDSKNNNENIDSKNIILHLPINTKNIIKISKEDELLTYDPEMKEPIGWQMSKLAGNTIDSVAFINDDEEKIQNYSNYPFDKKEQEIVNILVDDSSENNDEEPLKIDNKVENIDIKHNKNWYLDNKSSNEESNFDEMIDNIRDQRRKDLENYSINSLENCTQSTLIQFKENNKSDIWPNSTSIYCWWCCHPFNNSPCSLPHDYNDGKFYVYGIFCSPECAASYNFDTKSNKIWERYSLLNLLYRKIYNDKNIKIKLAPPREVLKIFGGSLKINNFRLNNTNYNKTYNIITPPMISIIPQQEFSFSDVGYTSNINKNKINLDKNNEEYRLKRVNPFVSSKNPLEKCMNLSLLSE
jgi:hypothetical protein